MRIVELFRLAKTSDDFSNVLNLFLLLLIHLFIYIPSDLMHSLQWKRKLFAFLSSSDWVKLQRISWDDFFID